MALQRTPWQIQRAVVFALLMRELKTRFEGRLTAGVVWLFLVPLAELMMFLWMNTTIRGRISRGGYEFVVWLLVAMVPYQLFRGLWGQLTNAPSANRGLFGFRQVKPMDAFVARTLLEVTLETITFVLMALTLARIGYGPLMPRDVLAFVGMVAEFCLLGVGMGVTWAVIVDVMPRFNTITHIIAMPLMIASGVILPLHDAPQQVLHWLMLNPVLHMVELARHAYLPGYVMVQGVDPWFPAQFTLVMVTVGVVLYRLRHKQLIAR